VFAESRMVIYRPKGGLPRPIRAIIDRQPPEPLFPGQPRPLDFVLVVSVPNDPVTGIEHRTFDAGGDTIDVPLVYGGPLVNRTFSAERAVVDAARITLKVV
jgi:hypothetical protein